MKLLEKSMKLAKEEVCNVAWYGSLTALAAGVSGFLYYNNGPYQGPLLAAALGAVYTGQAALKLRRHRLFARSKSPLKNALVS